MKTFFLKTIGIVKRERGFKGRAPKKIFHANIRAYIIGNRYRFSTEDVNKKVLIYEAKAIAVYEEKISTGVLTKELLKTFNRKIGQYISNSTKLKIGITSRDPKERFTEHLNEKNWKRMVVLYRTSSEKQVKDLEAFLIDNFEDDLVNDVAGGGGDLSNSSPNFLYIISR